MFHIFLQIFRPSKPSMVNWVREFSLTILTLSPVKRDRPHRP